VEATRPTYSLLLVSALLASVVVFTQVGSFVPPILTGSDKSMEQYESLRIHVERDGPLDAIVIGNSSARQGVITRRLIAELEEELGQPVRAYNFSAGGTGARMLPYLVELAYGIDRPPNCIFVLTPRIFIASWTETAEERLALVERSPYYEALADPLPWRSAVRRMLLDRVSLFGLRFRVKRWLLGQATPPREPGRYDENLGYQLRKRTPKELQWEKVRRRLHDWRIHENRNRAIAEAVRLAQSYGARVWLVEGALHPQAIASMVEPVEKMRIMRKILRGIAEETGADWIALPQEGYTANDFVDTSHLNAQGATKYTHWLAESLLQRGLTASGLGAR
jgi:hypothetical protein